MDIDGLKMIKITAVFYHELGHFVAKEINHRFYKGSGTSEILIYPCKQDIKEFCGHTNPIIPENEDGKQPVPLYKLGEHLASLSYGCFFQAYHYRLPLNFCQRNYGKDDEDRKIKSLEIHSINLTIDELYEIDNQHFNYLVQQQALQTFMSLNAKEYLIDNGNDNFEINIEKLKLDTEDSIIQHYHIYKGLVSKYEEAIQKDVNPPQKLGE